MVLEFQMLREFSGAPMRRSALAPTPAASSDSVSVVSARRLLVVAPHPDDESLATGGLISRAASIGAAVRIVFLTDGEANPIPQRHLERRIILRPQDRRRWAAMRRQEAESAVSELGRGIESHFLALPDGRLRGSGEALRQAIGAEIAAFQPDLLVRPTLEDTHGDHRAAALACKAELARCAARPAELTYLVHGRFPRSAPQLRFRLSREEQERKRRAVERYASQLALSHRRFLSMVRPEESYGAGEGEVPPLLPGLQRVLEVVSGVLS